MKTQDQLRLMAEDWHSRIGYNQASAALSKAADEFDATQTQLAASQAQIKVLRDAIENCRLLAARYRKEEWAPHILRFCESGGSVANPLRQDDSALRELLKAERERCAKVIEKQDVDPSFKHRMADAIRATKDES